MLENSKGVINEKVTSPKWLRIVLCIVLFTVGIGLVISSIYAVVEDIENNATVFDTIKVFVEFMGIGILILIYAWEYMSVSFAKYEFNTDGVIVKYPMRAKKNISWDKFQQVCICYAGYTTRGERRAHSVICCVKKGEKPNMLGRWKIGYLFHYQSIIYMEYTYQLYEEIKEKCPYEVVDLRKTRTYRL